MTTQENKEVCTFDKDKQHARQVEVVSGCVIWWLVCGVVRVLCVFWCVLSITLPEKPSSCAVHTHVMRCCAYLVDVDKMFFRCEEPSLLETKPYSKLLDPKMHHSKIPSICKRSEFRYFLQTFSRWRMLNTLGLVLRICHFHKNALLKTRPSF